MDNCTLRKPKIATQRRGWPAITPSFMYDILRYRQDPGTEAGGVRRVCRPLGAMRFAPCASQSLEIESSRVRVGALSGVGC